MEKEEGGLAGSPGSFFGTLFECIPLRLGSVWGSRAPGFDVTFLTGFGPGGGTCRGGNNLQINQST